MVFLGFFLGCQYFLETEIVRVFFPERGFFVLVGARGHRSLGRCWQQDKPDADDAEDAEGRRWWSRSVDPEYASRSCWNCWKRSCSECSNPSENPGFRNYEISMKLENIDPVFRTGTVDLLVLQHESLIYVCQQPFQQFQPFALRNDLLPFEPSFSIKQIYSLRQQKTIKRVLGPRRRTIRALADVGNI